MIAMIFQPNDTLGWVLAVWGMIFLSLVFIDTMLVVIVIQQVKMVKALTLRKK
jgi:hypothetical protein